VTVNIFKKLKKEQAPSWGGVDVMWANLDTAGAGRRKLLDLYAGHL
jgi:hypothetical protein